MVKLETDERLYVRIARRITGLMESGDFKAGEKLPSERDLATMLNVSRPSIREAMIALEVSGIIEVRTGSGIYVCDTPFSPLADAGPGPFEILEMRLLIEPEACALAAERINGTQLAQLQNIFSELERSDGTPEMEDFDKQFHCLIGEASENTAIARTISWLWDLRSQSPFSRRYHRMIVTEGVYPGLEEHRNIFTALVDQDPTAARNAMHRHLIAATDSAAKHFNDPL